MSYSLYQRGEMRNNARTGLGLPIPDFASARPRCDEARAG
jgi:hypothetical protein